MVEYQKVSPEKNSSFMNKVHLMHNLQVDIHNEHVPVIRQSYQVDFLDFPPNLLY